MVSLVPSRCWVSAFVKYFIPMLLAKLIGPPQLWWQQTPLSLKGKPLGLVVYLLLNGQAVPRNQAAEALWGPEGGHNLRQALYTLRRLPGAGQWLQDGENLRVLGHSDLDIPPTLEQALDPTPLLQGLEGIGSEVFLEWLEEQRLHWAERLQAVLLLEAQEGGPQAETCWQRLLQLDPFSEETLAQWLQQALERGQAQSALKAFERFRSQLAELGQSPSGPLLALAQKLRDRRLPQLSTNAQRTARALAIGAPQQAEVLAAVLEIENWSAAEALAELEGMGFSLAQAQEVIAHTPASVQQLLHRRLASLLPASTPPQERAWHWLKAHQPEPSLPLWQAAGQQALRGGQLAEARLYFYRLLWASPPSQTRADAVLQLARLAESQNDLLSLAALNDELETLAKTLQDDGLFFWAHFNRAGEYLRSGRLAHLFGHGQEALDIARRLKRPDLAQQAQVVLGTAYLASGQLPAAQEAFGEALSSPDPSVKLRANANLGAVLGMMGQLEQALAHQEEALTLARQLGSLPVVEITLFNLGATAERLGRYDRAERFLREAIELAKRVSNPASTVRGLLGLSTLHQFQGALGPAWNTAQEAHELAQERAPNLLAQSLKALGELAALLEQHSAARAWLLQAKERFEQAADVRGVRLTEANLALLGVREGSLSAPQALEVLQRLREAGYTDQWQRGRLELATLSSDATLLATCLQDFASANLHLQRLAHWLKLRLDWLQTGLAQPQALANVLGEQPVLEWPLVLGWLAQMWQVLGQPQNAQQALQQAQQLQQQQRQGLPKTFSGP